ncbi:MAG: class I SAM-dependent methyltransferase [Pseudomonadota bacterium]
MQRAYLKALHGRYWPYRHHDVPFPIESVVAWYTLFALQDDLGVTGDVLEMGVEHGGTAFLAMMALRDSERLELIDIEKSPRFAEKAAALPEDVADRVVFHECSTRSETLSEITARQFRFVHIDAGHSKADVLDVLRGQKGWAENE